MPFAVVYKNTLFEYSNIDPVPLTSSWVLVVVLYIVRNFYRKKYIICKEVTSFPIIILLYFFFLFLSVCSDQDLQLDVQGTWWEWVSFGECTLLCSADSGVSELRERGWDPDMWGGGLLTGWCRCLQGGVMNLDLQVLQNYKKKLPLWGQEAFLGWYSQEQENRQEGHSKETETSKAFFLLRLPVFLSWPLLAKGT